MQDRPYSTQVVALLEHLDLPSLAIRFWDIMYERLQRSESRGSSTNDGDSLDLLGRKEGFGYRVFVDEA